jgi:cell division protein FtsB
VSARRLRFSTDLFVVVLVLALSALLGRALHRRAVQITALQSEKSGLEATLSTLRADNLRLTREREALLTDPVFIEKQARESLGLRREGELMLPPTEPRERPRPVPPPETGAWGHVNRAMRSRLFPFAFPLAATALAALVLAVGRAAGPRTGNAPAEGAEPEPPVALPPGARRV